MDGSGRAGSESGLLSALNRALSIDDASREAIRPITGNREVAALLRQRFCRRDDRDFVVTEMTDDDDRTMP